MRKLAIACALTLALAACKKDGEGKTKDPKTTETSAAKTTADKPADKPTAQAEPASGGQAFDASVIYDVAVNTLDGKPSKIGDHQGKALLIVNVASKCGLTPQYATLESMQKKYADKGFTVLGFPCNQFGGQEPGSSEEIAEFCSKTYGVTFPMFEKIDVNGDNRHEIYKTLTGVKDADGEAGDIKWNFEKFVISADGKTIHRFRPKTVPNDPKVVAAIKAGLPTSAKAN